MFNDCEHPIFVSDGLKCNNDTPRNGCIYRIRLPSPILSKFKTRAVEGL